MFISGIPDEVRSALQTLEKAETVLRTAKAQILKHYAGANDRAPADSANSEEVLENRSLADQPLCRRCGTHVHPNEHDGRCTLCQFSEEADFGYWVTDSDVTNECGLGDLESFDYGGEG